MITQTKQNPLLHRHLDPFQTRLFKCHTRRCTFVQPHASSGPSSQPPRRFADFIQHNDDIVDTKKKKTTGDTSRRTSKSPPGNVNAEQKAEELIARTSSLLLEARAALDSIRKKEPSDRAHNAVQSNTIRSTKRPTPTSLPFLFESDMDDDDDESDSIGSSIGSRSGSTTTTTPPSSNTTTQTNTSTTTNNNTRSSSSLLHDKGPTSLDSWFKNKIDPGTLHVHDNYQSNNSNSTMLMPMKDTTTTTTTMSSNTSSVYNVAVLDRPNLPSSLQFQSSDTTMTEISSIFPESISLRFQSDAMMTKESSVVQEEVQQMDTVVASIEEQVQSDWHSSSGEEFGPDGYWYRWTEISGKDATGTVQWYEKWWEISDWKGMKEMGAEKWGLNERGDAWRETWRETIGFEPETNQPTVERSAHKWARTHASHQEWEEKWNEKYWSNGKADKWADKWGKDGGDVWHERWGESYDGDGGCVKWTDRWAERPSENNSSSNNSGGLDKWGDKWEEKFKDGRGSKQGETWSEKGDGEKYQRWWGENHFGDGHVQKFGHSTTGEYWDTTEQMDTYYNPIPHFGYDLALSHSPQLRSVPTLPRDDLFVGGSGGGGDKNGGGDDDLSSIFG